MTRTLPFFFLLAVAGCADAPADQTSGAPPSGDEGVTSTQVTGRTTPAALVSLEPTGALSPLPDGHAVLDQYSKSFIPDPLFVRVGQPVLVKNSEDQLHNVTVVRTRTGTGVFNISQNQGDVYTHTFDQPGEYDVTCDVHPGMRATIVAVTTPHAVYSDPRGAFSFENISPGAYMLRVSAGGRETVRPLDVAGARMDVGDVRADGR